MIESRHTLNHHMPKERPPQVFPGRETWTQIYNIQSGPFAKKITRSLKDITILLASQNYNLIIDDVALGAIEVDEWRQALKDYDVLYVGVVTPLNVLEERQRSRGDRIKGSARSQYFKVHDNVAYDIEVDTHRNSLKDNVLKIQEALNINFPKDKIN